MALFVVIYDLKSKNKEKRDYGPIEDALEALESCRTEKSAWYVDRSGTAKSLYDYLKRNVRDDDRLMVVEFDKKPVWQKGMPGTKAWIEERFD